MRFDDRLATVLAQPAADAPARAVAWCQLVDLLAQMRAANGSPVVAEAYQRLEAWRNDVPSATRIAVAAAVAGHPLPLRLIRYFAADSASVAAPVIGGAELSADAWLGLIPELPPTARALLRHRRDLGGEVERLLAHYSASDFVIGGPAGSEPLVETPPAEPEPQPQIADLVARIEAFRRNRESLPPIGDTVAPAPLQGFAFETDWDGMLVWVDAEERGALIGLSLAASAELFGAGFDGQAAGAFRRRTAFGDARLLVAGEGSASGEWRVSGVPVFDDRSGRFLGFRGKARRPRFGERAEPVAAGLYGSSVTPESLRSLVHELRTPLNAIVGFAEMIDRQILGPASAEYRARAAAILTEARRLSDAVDDLDTAARIETQSLPIEPVAVDAAALLARLQRQFGVGDRLRVSSAAGVPPLAADHLAAERMFGRLIGALLGVGAEEEPLDAELAGDVLPGRVRFSAALPALLAGRAERELLDPGFAPDGDLPDAPLLGLGFSLRLVRNLAEANGGRLLVEADRVVLLLPAALQPAEENLVQS